MYNLLFGRRFLSSPNFVGWFSVRKEEANQKLRLLHLDMLCKTVGKPYILSSRPASTRPPYIVVDLEVEGSVE